MVCQVVKWKWGDTILKAHCFHCRNFQVAFICSIKDYKRLTSSEYLNLSETKWWISEWILSVRSSECRVRIFCNSTPTNWSIVKSVFLDELVCPAELIKVFVRVSNYLNSTGVFASMSILCFAIFISESSTMSLARAINTSKTNIGVVANDVEMNSCSY